MKIILNNSSMVPIYEQLMDQIKNEIIEGTLTAGMALPSVRALSRELKISALTVKKAYDRLDEDGFIVTVHGKGSFVAETDQNLAMEACRKAVEEDFEKVIQKAQNFGFTKDEILDIVSIILEED
ncbi:MAG: GntR family transcriptional regulator [Lachnospiraceae bacterium]|nr:GntR family transcriptional regulator [Lachnospiraceae bacterium]